ncbi:MAG: GtrA family protein [Clostridia bacterium]|nr:GtrA family protein [Clostridia bacterium]
MNKMEKIKKLIKKLLTKEVILYLVFGVTTTLVNLGMFYLLNTILNWEQNVSNFIAIVISVLVAYVTNKDLVFHSEAKNIKEKLFEFFKFILGRAFTMLIEFIGGLIFFNLPIPNIIVKIGLNVIVVILNFIISRFFTFKKKSNKV